MPSSAQWMSSTQKSSGWRALAASISVPTAENRRSRICCGVVGLATGLPVAARRLDPERAPERRGEPLGGLVGRAPRVSASIPRQSLRQAVPASSVSTISKVPRTISARRPVGEAGAVGGAAAEPDRRLRIELADVDA